MNIDEPDKQKNASSPQGRLEEVLGELRCVSQGCRSLSWQEAEKIHNEALRSFASTHSLSEALQSSLESEVDAFVGGDEHNNFTLENYSSRVFKITHSNSFGCKVRFDPFDPELTGKNFIAQGNDCPHFYLRRWQLLNSISDYQVQLEGILSPERAGWLPRICISQPYIAGKNPSQDEITQSLVKYNYLEVSRGAYYNLETNILLTDTFPRNVRIVDGEPALFDAIASEPCGETLDWLREKISNIT
ncbi:hypothetical protein Rhal01_01682 [Rubritalea halochordaticola]|uniref:Uncharacterized protein n=1 Tax=Rubritalea halochordaticola TaxID=714537 RepID=A0ABP9UYP6_9BACT